MSVDSDSDGVGYASDDSDGAGFYGEESDSDVSCCGDYWDEVHHGSDDVCGGFASDHSDSPCEL